MNWGECFYDHYAKLFGSPKTQAMFQSRPGAPRIQVLGYEGVFGGGARVYCTLGLTHYSDTVGRPLELVVVVDDGFADAQKALANASFFAVANRMRVGVGTIIVGVQNVAPDLALRWGKSALYITSPYSLPPGAEDVRCGEAIGKLYMALLVSQAECECIKAKGPAEFESLLEAAQADPIHIGRPSAC